MVAAELLLKVPLPDKSIMTAFPGSFEPGIFVDQEKIPLRKSRGEKFIHLPLWSPAEPPEAP